MQEAWCHNTRHVHMNSKMLLLELSLSKLIKFIKDDVIEINFSRESFNVI